MKLYHFLTYIVLYGEVSTTLDTQAIHSLRQSGSHNDGSDVIPKIEHTVGSEDDSSDSLGGKLSAASQLVHDGDYSDVEESTHNGRVAV